MRQHYGLARFVIRLPDPHFPGAKRAFGEAMRKLGRKLMKEAAPVSRAYQKHALARERGERQAQAWLAR